MSTARYFTTGTSSMLAFDLSMGSLTLAGSEITYRGNAGIDRVFVGSGLTFDFTQSLGGADKLYLNGALADYTLSVSGSIVILTRSVDNTTVRVNGADSQDTLVFLDGSIGANALRQYALGIVPDPGLAGETSALSAADVSASELNGLATIRGFASTSGAVFGTVPAGAALQVRGTSGVETVYVKAGSQVDATQLLGGMDRIYLTGLFADYDLSVSGSVLTLTRQFDTHLEAVRVIGGDALIFADGTVTSASVVAAVRDGTALPVPAGERTPGVPIAESVAITSDAGADGFYKAGDVVQISVSFSETVLVTGTPLLQINVGGEIRTAAYSGGHDTDTLHFQYTIGDDNDADGISIELAALELNGAIIRTLQGERAIVLTPALADQIGHKVDTIAPDTPTMDVIADDDVIGPDERATATVQGTAEAYATIELSFSSGFTRQVQAEASGNWSYSLTGADFAAMGVGSETITAIARDAAGNTNGFQTQRAITVQALDSTPPQITGPSGSAGAASSITDLAENGSAVHTFTADEAVVWSLNGGIDAAHFTIDAGTGALSFVSPPDFEAPTDDGANNTYTVTVRATDAAGNHSDQTVTITVTNVNDNAPVITSGASVNFAENGTGVVYTATATDADNLGALTYSLGGADAALFDIDASTGQVTFKNAPDYENPLDAGGDNVYDITVTASDGTHTTDQAVAITVTDVGEAGQSVIDLGTWGQLLHGVQVEGKWYYVWDRDGSGIHSTGSDNFSTGELNTIFRYDANGVLETAGNAVGTVGQTDNTFRYATINGVKVALPTYGAGLSGINASPTDVYKNGTAVSGPGQNNATYDDLLAIWDAHNGAGTGTNSNGTPSGWFGAGYWSATPSSLGYVHVNLDVGFAGASSGGSGLVALQVLDTTAPIFLSGSTASIAENSAISTVVYDANANDGDGSSADQWVTYSLGGVDAALFNINASTGQVTFKNAPNYENPLDVGGDNVYNIIVIATDVSNNTTQQAVAITVTDVADSSAGDSVIDLGTWGQLIHGVQVEGKWYYVWDRNGNGNHGGAADRFTHDELDAIFRYDVNGVLETAGNAVGAVGDTDNTFRYVTLNGVQVALPTYGAGLSGINASPVNVYKNGTTVNSPSQNNPTYDDLLAIWDAHNGAGTGTNTNGTPSGWGIDGYWSATPSPSGHASVGLAVGHVDDGIDDYNFQYVALRVIDTTAPIFLSGGTASIAENSAISTVVYDADANDGDGSNADQWVTYSLGGVDAALFNINASTGQVTFKNAPNYENPLDVGGDNVYNIIVIATDVSNNTTQQAVAITVTDASEAFAGDTLIDLGTWGQLIHGVQVEGKWYYVWDRNGNGILDGNSSDEFNHNELDAIFRYNASGVLETAGNAVGAVGDTDNTFRYATINGVQVALPTYGAGLSGINASPTGVYKNGTAVNNPSQNNPTYDDLLAIWDAYNGSGTGTNSNGVPSGWLASGYWSATPSPAGHAAVNLNIGGVIDGNDGSSNNVYVALQVLDTTAPIFLSGSTASIAENTSTSTVVYDANANDGDGSNADQWVTYSLGGVDAVRFNINASTGQVTFKNAPDYENPLDAGADNVYNIIVTATDVSNNTTQQAVAITVTDINDIELARIAAGIGGFVINGQAADDRSGFSVSSAGDVNGDGLADLIVGAYLSDPAGMSDAGRSYVVFGKADGTAINLSAVAAGIGGFVINGQAASDQSGISVSSAGDVNGDGLDDLIVGAWQSDPPGMSDAGRSYVVFGKADGTAINLSAVANGVGGFVINGQAAGDASGYSVSSAGDVNGDGLDDLIVGAPRSDPAGMSEAGRSYVVFGKADTTAINLSVVANGIGGFVINGQAASDRSGLSVSSAGDVNGDGLDDLIVGADRSDPAGMSDAGRSYVVFGKANTTAINLSAVANGIGGFVINGQAASDQSGISVSSAGDVNGDGLDDLIVGADRSDPAGMSDAGRSYVVFGKADTTAINLSAVAAGIGGFVINGQAAGDNSGRVSSAGDINGDGLDDLIVGAVYSDPAAGTDAGRTYVVYGKADTTAIDLSAVANGVGGFVINGQAEGDLSGISVSSAGDVDGDGLADLIVGAQFSDPATVSNAGRSYVILSSQVGQGNFGAELTQLGTSGNDTLTGTAGIDRIAAGAGNDILIGNGGADMLYGGAGHDTFVLNASNLANLSASRIDGGTGRDTIVFDTDVSGVVDLRGLTGQALKGIEALDISGGGNVTVRTGLRELLNLEGQGAHNAWNSANWGTTVTGNTAAINGTNYQQILVKGDAGDIFELYGGSLMLVPGGTVNADGRSYHIYNDTIRRLQLIVDSEVTLENINAEINLANIAAGIGGFVLNGQVADDWSGRSVSSAGDVNGDGLADLIVGAPDHDIAGVWNTGRSYVVFGKADGTAINLSAVAAGVGGFAINGREGADNSGFSVSSAGDVNGDGLDDLIVGGYQSYTGTVGRSYVVFGKASGTAVNLSAVLNGTGGFVINGEASDSRSGYSVSSAGDVNGDGLADLIVGSPRDSSSPERSYVVFGKATGAAVNLSAVVNGVGGFVINGQEVVNAGSISVSSAGDVNGDGLDDLIVGAFAIANEAGRSYVVFGKATGTAINLSAVANGIGGFAINGQPIPGNRIGGTVSSAGDVNGDGLADLIVGPQSGGRGSTYVVFGKADTTAIDLSTVDNGIGGFVINRHTGQVSSVSNAGDINGDGLDDLIIGVYNADPLTGTDAGSTYIVYGKADTTAIDLSAVANGIGGFVINGQAAGDNSGGSVSSAGDVDGDGLADLIVGASNSDPAGMSSAGRSYVILSSQVGQGNFGAELTELGTSGDDTLTGTAGVDRIAAGTGDDIIIGGGGADVLYGGAGNDIFVLNASNVANLAASRIDGGTGRDTIVFDTDVTGVVDLRGLTGQALKGIEALDISGGGNVTVRTTLRELLNLEGQGAHNAWNSANWGTTVTGNTAAINGTNFQQILIKGNAGDVFEVHGDMLAMVPGGTVNADGRSYNVYNDIVRRLQLIVDSEVTLERGINDLYLLNIASGLGGFVINGQVNGDNSGWSVSSAGDVNGDGLDDLIIGAPSHNPGPGAETGRSYVVFGKADGTAINLSAVANGIGGFAINGQAAVDRAGLSVSSAGDVNGDGLADLIVGARHNDTWMTEAGRSYVIFGKTTGTAVSLASIAAGSGGFVINGQAVNDISGWSVSSAGDVNGDGLDDLIVGAPYSDPAAGNEAGRSYVVFGKANTSAVNLSAVASGNGGFVINGHMPGDYSGLAVSGAGDVNGDGLDDLIVTAPASDPTAGTDAGRSYVVFGKATGTAVHLSNVANGNGGFVINGQAPGDAGYDDTYSNVSSAGDVNGDGLDDLIVGAPRSDPAGSSNAGRSYVVFGKADTTAVNLSAVANGVGGFVINGQAAGDLSGQSVSSAGDINGDGLADLIVGARESDPATGSTAGRTYIVYGKADGTAIDLSAVAQGIGGFVINGQAVDDRSGHSVSSAGDVDGDGLADLIVGAPYSDLVVGTNSNQGRSYVILSSQVGQGNFGAELTQLGTSGNDTLTGGTGVDRIAAGTGDDIIIGGGGADVLYGGAGNDIFVLNASNVANLANSRIDGGTGRDTIVFDTDVTGVVDLRGLTGQALKGIEAFDISGGGNVTVRTTLRELLNLEGQGAHNAWNSANWGTTVTGNTAAINGTNFQQILIKGNAGDVFEVHGDMLAMVPGGTVNADGRSYNVYNDIARRLQLIVDSEVTLERGINDLYLLNIASGLGGFVINGQVNGDNSGWSVSSAGDVNGDGLDDLIIGAPSHNPGPGAETGRSYVVFGKADGTAINLSAVANGIGGFAINGQAAVDRAGLSVSSAGDVNGDGLADLIVGARHNDTWMTEAGRSYVIFGKTTGTAVSLASIAAGSGGFVINGQAVNDISGWSVSSAGDVNGDGLDDLIVGAPYSDPAAGNEAGRSYVVFGKANTSAVNLSAVASGNGGFVINGHMPGDYSGLAVSGAGDVNGDGLDDLIVTAPASDPTAGTDAGRSYVVFGKATGTAVHLSNVANGNGGFVINGQAPGDAGYDDTYSNVSSAGDVNGDGLDDLIVGAPRSDPAGSSNAGRSYVVFGKADTTAVNLSAVANGVGGFVINGQAAGDLSGQSVSSAGDINGDGLADLIVGARESDPATGSTAGRTYIVYGKADGTAIDLSAVAQGIGGFVINGQAVDDRSGHSVSSAGDVDGDGLADLIVGAPYSDLVVGTNSNQGRSYVILSSQVGQGNFGAELTQLGTSGNDTLTGGTGVDRIAAGTGDDIIIGGGGADVLYGGAGNDIFVLNASNVANLANSRIDGGSGRDTLTFDGDVSGLVDLRGLAGSALKGIEVLDFSNGVANTLVFDNVTLRSLHDEAGQSSGLVNRVLVNGDAADEVHLSASSGSWSTAGTQVYGAITYDLYAHSANAVDRLWVEQGMNVVLM